MKVSTKHILTFPQWQFVWQLLSHATFLVWKMEEEEIENSYKNWWRWNLLRLQSNVGYWLIDFTNNHSMDSIANEKEQGKEMVIQMLFMKLPKWTISILRSLGDAQLCTIFWMYRHCNSSSENKYAFVSVKQRAVSVAPILISINQQLFYRWRRDIAPRLVHSSLLWIEIL